MCDEKWRWTEKCPIGKNRSASPEKFWLMHQRDAFAPWRLVAKFAYLVSEVMRVYQDVGNSVWQQQFEPIGKQRFTLYGDETFRRLLRKRP